MKFKLVENFIDDNFSKSDIMEYLYEMIDKSDIRQYIEEAYDDNTIKQKLIDIYPTAIDDINAENHEELIEDYLTNIGLEDDKELFEYFRELYNDELENELESLMTEWRPEYDADGNRIW